MARLVLVVGSRREGNSLHLAKMIEEVLAKHRILCDVITPGNEKIYLCTGCRDCDKTGVCDFTDDMKQNIDKIKKADGIVFISPVRWNTISGDIKIFMDRLNPLYVGEELKGKKALVIAIGSESKEDFGGEGVIDDVRRFAEKAKMEFVKSHVFHDCLEADAILNQPDEVSTLIEEIQTLFS